MIVECDSVLEWIKAQQPIATAIQDVREDLYFPATLVCPSIGGRREPVLAFEVVLNTTMETESDVVNTVLGLRLCAVQWTHDIEAAILMVSL